MSMNAQPLAAIAALLLALGAVGCSPSTPEHVEKPLSAGAPASANEFDNLTTPEEKIRYIENSKAPKVEKERAIEQIRSGKL